MMELVGLLGRDESSLADPSQPISAPWADHDQFDQDYQLSLAELDEIVLIHILAWLQDPQALASTCTVLHGASTSSICRQLWFQRWYPNHLIAAQRPLVLAALSWHGLRPRRTPTTATVATEQQLHAGPAQQQHTGALLQLLSSALGHYHHPDQQQIVQQLPYQLPSGVSAADISRVLHSSDHAQLKLLQQLTPWHEHLLMPAAAGAGNHVLLQQLLAEYGPAESAVHAAACSTSNSSSSSNAAPAGPSSSSSINVGPSSSTSVLQDGALRLQLWLWRQHAPPSTLQHAVHGQHHGQHPGQHPAQQESQQTSPKVFWGKLVQPLPDFRGLKAFRHNLLQTSLIAAAKGNSPECLQLLLGQLVTCGASPWDCAEALTTVAEAAAAAGSLECLQLIWQVLQPRPAPLLEPEVEHAANSLSEKTLRVKQQLEQQMIARQRNVAEPAAPPGDLQAAVLSALVRQPPMSHQMEMQRPQYIAEALQALEQVHIGQQQQQLQGQHALPSPASQQHQQQQQQHSPRPGQTALQWVASSTYLMVAAASSGCCKVLALVMQHMQAHMQKQQLPAALSAAGQRGHVAVLQQLLHHQELSSRPLQLAASDAALYGWPSSTLLPLLDRMAALYNQELISLLAKPLVLALQQRRQDVVHAMFDVLVKEAALDQGDMLADALLLLAYQGQADRVSWIIQVAPTVLVKLGPRAAAAALEGGHPRVAQLILDKGGERPAAFKAAAKRGELTAAVAAGDATAVRELLHEVRLPLVWSCEALAVGGQGAPVAGIGTAVGGGGAGGLYGGPVGAHAIAEPAGAVPAGGAGRQTYPTHCLLTLLKSAALQDGPCSVDILRQLLWVLTDSEGQSRDRQHVLMALAKACFRAGRAEQLSSVVEAAGRPRAVQRRPFLQELRSNLQLPCCEAALTPQQQEEAQAQQQAQAQARISSAAASSNSSSSSSSVLAAAMALMEQPWCRDVVSSLLAQSYFAVCMPGEYLGSTARPMQPAVFIPSLQSLTELLLHLAQLPDVPPGARSRDLSLFRLLVRTVLQSCDVYLLHALLLFMQRHGAAVMGEMPEDALRALRVEAEAVQAAEGQGPAQHGAVDLDGA